MTMNMGTVDRAIRGVLGLVLILLPFVTSWGVFTSTLVASLSVIVGLIMAGTALFGICPLYSLIGVDTRQN